MAVLEIAKLRGSSESCRWEPDYPMANFPTFTHSNRAVGRAGDALKGVLTLTPETREETLRIFSIANQWRDSHMRPMKSMKYGVSSIIVRAGLSGITVARLKTTPSIRKKLRRHPGKLNQIQDLGGVRAILPSMGDASTLVRVLKERFRHQFDDEDDYIADPKMGGYRSFHLIYKFNGKGDAEEFNGRRIEIQIRSRLQHAWATAVEAAGLINQQDMKAGEGDERWLRLFELFSAEIAVVEGAPESRHVPDRQRRIKEIRELNGDLGAADVLDDLRYASGFLDFVSVGRNKPSYYLLEYDHNKREVQAIPKFGDTDALLEYHKRELHNAETNNENRKTVLVEADNVENLKAAYPNYFTDVGYFTRTLRAIVTGAPIAEYTLPPVHRAPRVREPIGDMRWMRGSYRRFREEHLPRKSKRNKTRTR